MSGVENAPAQILWNCKFEPLAGGPDLAAFTVGTKYKLACSGPSITPWNAVPKISFEKPEDEFTVVPLDLGKADANGAELVVTGYKPGPHKPAYILLGEGASQVRVEGLEWNINSVVKAEQGQPPPQPFPPYGPFVLFWPWWLWASIVGGILLIVAFVWWRVRRYTARKRLIERLRDRGAALSPYAQLHKDLRQLLRRYQGRTKVEGENTPENYLNGIDQSLRVYLSRTLLVPAQEWSDGAIVRDIKRRHRKLYKRAGDDLYMLLREIAHARRAKGLTFTDCAQIHEMSRKVTEVIETSSSGKDGSL